jgi:hypothetical protein
MTKKLFIFVVVLLLNIPAFGQVNISWLRTYNGPGNTYDEASSITIDGSNNVYVTGTSDDVGWDPDYATVKYDPNGNEIWVRRYSGPGDSYDFAVAIVTDNIGNVYVTGSSEGVGTDYDYATIKYDANGNELWIRRYNGPGNSDDEATGVAVDASGNVYVTGFSFGAGTYYDYATIKYDANGNEVWVKRYDGPANSYDYASAINVDVAGNVYLTGRSRGIGTYSDYATIKYNSNGDIVWTRRYDDPTSGYDEAVDLALDAANNVYVTGTINMEFYSGEHTTTPTTEDYATIKYDSYGNEVWVREYDGVYNSNDVACAITVDGSGNIYVTGKSYGETAFDYATVKYDPGGNKLWERRYDGPTGSNDIPSAITSDGFGNAYVTGYSYNFGVTGWDYATVKYAPNGDLLWVQRYSGPGENYDEANAIAVDAFNNPYVTGYANVGGTGADYTTIKYSECKVLQNITIYANTFVDLGGGIFTAKGGVWIGDQTGQKLYLYLGDDAQLTFNINNGAIIDIDYTNTKLSVNSVDFSIDNLASMSINAQDGLISFEGRVHYAASAIFPSTFSGACTLAVNARELYGRIRFDDSYFGSGTVGFHKGIWDLDDCPFMGMIGDIDLTANIILTDLTVIEGQITLGVFLLTGICRVGLTNAGLEFKESGGAFGLNLTGLLAPPGIPSQGMIDIDLAHLQVNVVRDIPIGLWKFTKDSTSETFIELDNKEFHDDWKSLRNIDQNKYTIDVYDNYGNKYQKLLVDAGLTVKGEEPYTDLDCDGNHDPGEPFEDEDHDGLWDEGTSIALRDQFNQYVFDAHGHASLYLKLASYVKLTCVEAVLDIDYPNSNVIELETWAGLMLGNIFTIDLAYGVLELDFQQQIFSADVTLRSLPFSGTTFNGHLLVGLNPLEFETSITQNSQIMGVSIMTGGQSLRVGEGGLFLDADMNAFSLLSANARIIYKDWSVEGIFNSDFSIDGWRLSQIQSSFYFAPNQCMSVTAGVRFCPIPWFCPGGRLTFRICSASNWGVTIGGKFIRLKCPANLHVYDSQGRHTGLNQTGGIDLEIPGSEFYFSVDSSLQLIFIPGFDLDVCTIDVVGESSGVIDLDVLYPNTFDSKVYDFTFYDESTQQGALHRVIFDSTNTWTMLNDLDGDSIFESQTEPDSTAEANLDTTMVIITNVASEIVCANDAKVTWNTNVPATSKVLYRSEHDSVYESVSDTTLTTSHSVVVDSILTTDTYYYIVVSVDTSGNIASFLEKSFKLEYLVGDANGDGQINLADAVYLVNYLFIGGPPPDPLEAGDANCDGEADLADAVYIINYLFIGGPPPCSK